MSLHEEYIYIYIYIYFWVYFTHTKELLKAVKFISTWNQLFMFFYHFHHYVFGRKMSLIILYILLFNVLVLDDATLYYN